MNNDPKNPPGAQGQWDQYQNQGYPPAPGPMQAPQGYPPQQYHQGYPQQGYGPQPYGYAPPIYAPPPVIVVQQSNMMMAQQTMVNVKAPFNHGIHIVLSLVTCGIWVPVWILCAVAH